MIRNTGYKDLNLDEIKEKMNEPEPDFIDDLGDDYLKNVIGMGLPLGSYNAKDVVQKYPDIPIDMSHDGVIVVLEVEELDGSHSIIQYWGD